jgi:hypothetical protein
MEGIAKDLITPEHQVIKAFLIFHYRDCMAALLHPCNRGIHTFLYIDAGGAPPRMAV